MNRTLWQTEVGSFMWGDQHPGSDHDYFTAYVVPTEEILSGINHGGGSHASHDPAAGVDRATHEIGRVVEQLCKGNVNFIWGVLSPLVCRGSPELVRLRQIVLGTRSLAPLHSIRGMAESQICDIPTHPEVASKKLRAAIRTVNFGIRWIDPATYVADLFMPTVVSGPDPYQTALQTLQRRAEASGLPSMPDPGPFREFLLDVRLKFLDRQVLKRVDTAMI